MTDRRARPEAGPVAGASSPEPPIEPVTGVAAGALGTATNLDDTQRYSLDDLWAPAVSAGEPGAPAVEAPELSKPLPARMAPARTGRVVARPRLRQGSRLPYNRAGALAVGGLVVALAVVLTLRDGAPNTGAGSVGVDGVAGAAGTFPPLPGFIAAETPAPVATPGLPGGHGNGRGNGHGHH